MILVWLVDGVLHSSLHTPTFNFYQTTSFGRGTPFFQTEDLALLHFTNQIIDADLLCILLGWALHYLPYVFSLFMSVFDIWLNH